MKRGLNTYVDLMKALEAEVPMVIQKFRGRDAKGKDRNTLGDELDMDNELMDDEFDMSSMTDFMDTTRKSKRKRESAAAMRAKQGDTLVSRNVPKDQRKGDEEILGIGLRSLTEPNKTRWREAPYVSGWSTFHPL